MKHLAHFWVGTTLISGSFFGRRQQIAGVFLDARSTALRVRSICSRRYSARLAGSFGGGLRCGLNEAGSSCNPISSASGKSARTAATAAGSAAATRAAARAANAITLGGFVVVLAAGHGAGLRLCLVRPCASGRRPASRPGSTTSRRAPARPGARRPWRHSCAPGGAVGSGAAAVAALRCWVRNAR